MKTSTKVSANRRLGGAKQMKPDVYHHLHFQNNYLHIAKGNTATGRCYFSIHGAKLFSKKKKKKEPQR